MSRSSCASILLGLVCLLAWAALAQDDGARTPLSKPMGVTLRLVDDSQPLVGELVAWDTERVWVRGKGEDAVEREVRWTSIQPQLGFDIARRLISADSPQQWTWLGLVMLESRSEAMAKRAFDVAVRLNPDLKAQVADAMTRHAAGQDPAEAFRQTEKPPDAPAGTTTTNTVTQPARPERKGVTLERVAGKVRPWPKLSAEEQATHTEQVRQACSKYLEKASLKIEPIETRNFLFYSELSKPETQRWAKELDRMYATLLTTLEIPADSELFQGKCAVFLLKERSSFIEFERKAFATDATKFGGVNHQRSGYAFTVFYKGANEQEFNSVLIHETVHAFMYRYRSGIALPTWANEGLADFVAGHLVTYSTEPQSHWNHARNYVAMKKNVLSIMNLSYAEGSWPTDDSYPVSHMLVRFLLKNKPREFKLWIDDIKAGVDWREAMIKQFGITPEVLAQGFGVDILQEPGYSRLR